MALTVFASVCAVVLGNALWDTWTVSDAGAGVTLLLKVCVFALLLLLFTEIIPRAAASVRADGIVMSASVPLAWLVAVLRPLTFFITRPDAARDHTAHRKVEISIDELSNVIEMTSDQSAEGKKMLSGIVDFVNTEVSEVMKTRVDIVSLEISDSFARVKEVIISSGFSRIPVYSESLDEIMGVLYVKDLLPYISRDEFDWKTLLRKPYFVPEHKKINDLLEEFRTNQVHIAIVVDEYGSTMGLLSLEDILEEIVGEISDESDVEHQFYTKLAPDVYLFDAKTNLSEFLKVLGLDDDYFDDVRGEAESLAGLMLEMRKDFISAGDTVQCNGFTLSAEKVDGRRVDKIKAVYDPGDRG